MIRFGIAQLRRLSLLAPVILSTTAAAFGQSTQWSPTRPSRPTVTTESNRSSGRASTAGYASGGNSESAIRRAQYTADWQRRPSAATSNSYRSERPAALTAQSHRRAVVASQGSAGSRTVAAQYGIELREGEQLVGQPQMSEGGRAEGNRDVLPVPDGVSSDPMTTTGPRIQGEIVQEGEMLHEGGPYVSGDIFQGEQFQDNGQIGCTDGCASGDCGPGGCGGGCMNCARDEWADPRPCPGCGVFGYHRFGCGRVAACLDNCLGPLIREWSIFAGTQGFKGPIDLGTNGNFGFNEGFNLAGPIIPFPRFGIGYQAGARFTQSDLSGNIFGTNTREQQFLTGGIFHRAYRHRGLQWGVVYDWVSENYYTKNSLAQIRAEISFLTGCGHEIGFLGSQGLKEDTNDLVPNFILRPTDQYNLFYRHTTERGAQGRIFGGVTGQSLGIFGADFRVPMSNRVEFNGGFTYISPDNGQNGGGQQDESWGLGMNIAWFFGRRKDGVHNTPYRPLFNVADNGSLMLDRM
jgi:hypothetical protein